MKITPVLGRIVSKFQNDVTRSRRAARWKSIGNGTFRKPHSLDFDGCQKVSDVTSRHPVVSA